MKKIVINSLFTLCCLALFMACKKYPEGGYEKDGPKNIIYTWKLTLYEVDGIDSTNLINYNSNENYKTILFSGNSKIGYCGQPYGGSCCLMYFSSNNEVLTGTVDPYYGGKVCYTGGCTKEIFTPETSSATWKILKLDSNELHLQSQQIHSYNLKFHR